MSIISHLQSQTIDLQSQHVNMKNFTHKFQAVAEETANNFRWLLVCRT